MARRFLVSLAALAAVAAAACGGTTLDPSQNANPTLPTEPVLCGGEAVHLTPLGDTYDDTKGSSSVQALSFEMSVYPAGGDAGDAGLSAPPSGTAECPASGAIAQTTQAIDLAPGDYWLCRNAAFCGCVKARLTGGSATFYWGAGPGGGNLEVRGCGTALR
jgi:hypothetical protein